MSWQNWVPNEAALFWRILAAAIFAIGIWEIFQPNRSLSRSVLARWGSHTTLFATATALGSLILPIGLVTSAFAVQKTAYGQFVGSHVPYFVRFVAAILLIDFSRYLGHYACHAFGPLWRVHSIHHSDTDFDLTTGLRHHPLETLVFQGVELAVIVAMALPPAAVLVSEIAAGVQSLLMHANAVCPPAFDRFLRYFFITPSFHLIHHSADVKEQSANFGILFPWWDRMFHTCIERPRLGDALRIGLDGVPERRALNVWYLLAMPFGRMPGTVDAPQNEHLPSPAGTGRLPG